MTAVTESETSNVSVSDVLNVDSGATRWPGTDSTLCCCWLSSSCRPSTCLINCRETRLSARSFHSISTGDKLNPDWTDCNCVTSWHTLCFGNIRTQSLKSLRECLFHNAYLTYLSHLSSLLCQLTMSLHVFHATCQTFRTILDRRTTAGRADWAGNSCHLRVHTYNIYINTYTGDNSDTNIYRQLL